MLGRQRILRGRAFASRLKARTTILLFLGIIVLISGTIFTLQGLGMLGPTNGFMYRSSTWVFQGSVAALIGAVLVVLALALAMTAKPQQEPGAAARIDQHSMLY